jgi:ribonucleotide reductase beta subunit family protein with ferritin-like domain
MRVICQRASRLSIAAATGSRSERDSAIVADEIQLTDPQTLYGRWEDSQWSPFAIDLDTDRAQWPELPAEQRELLLSALSSLMVAEERITTKFSGPVGAHGTEEKATFLATQQVDEARHMQFYAHFQDEVIAAPDLIGAHVDIVRQTLRDRLPSVAQSLKPPCDGAAESVLQVLTEMPGHDPELLTERVPSEMLADEHHADQLVERMGWALLDAEQHEQDTQA